MDALTRLQEKNNKHLEIHGEERNEVHLGLINGTPLIIVSYYEMFSAHNIQYLEAAFAYFLAFVFSVLISAFGNMIVIKHWLRIIIHIMSQVWFCYFWIWQNDSKMAFLPLALIFILWCNWAFWNIFKKARKTHQKMLDKDN